MQALSEDLRIRVVRFVDDGFSCREAARRLGDPSPLNAAMLSERMAYSKELDDER